MLSPWAIQYVYGCSGERGENWVWERGGSGNYRASYADDLVLCVKLEEKLKAIVKHFVEMCRKRGLKLNADKSKVMVLSEEEGLECEICVAGA